MSRGFEGAHSGISAGERERDGSNYLKQFTASEGSNQATQRDVPRPLCRRATACERGGHRTAEGRETGRRGDAISRKSRFRVGAPRSRAGAPVGQKSGRWAWQPEGGPRARVQKREAAAKAGRTCGIEVAGIVRGKRLLSAEIDRCTTSEDAPARGSHVMGDAGSGLVLFHTKGLLLARGECKRQTSRWSSGSPTKPTEVRMPEAWLVATRWLLAKRRRPLACVNSNRPSRVEEQASVMI